MASTQSQKNHSIFEKAIEGQDLPAQDETCAPLGGRGRTGVEEPSEIQERTAYRNVFGTATKENNHEGTRSKITKLRRKDQYKERGGCRGQKRRKSGVADGQRTRHKRYFSADSEPLERKN